MPELGLTQSSNGSTVQAHEGDTLVLELPENPTTGYRWNLTSHDEILRLSGDSFQPSGSQGAGGGGIRTLRFIIGHSGDTELGLALVRPWQPDSPRETFSIHVHVVTQPR
jgi:inhibitor of cysteine peptidase